jgi:hypothetical protein
VVSRPYTYLPSSQSWPYTQTGPLPSLRTSNRAFESIVCSYRRLTGEHKGEDGLLQYFPASYDAAKANAPSHGTERSIYDHGLHLPHQQLIQHFIQPEKLSGLWDRAFEAIEGNLELLDFQGVVLFAAAKDLKSRYVSTSLSTVCSR